MDKRTSIYLNLLRTIATFAVFIGHFSYEQFSGGNIKYIGLFAHDAVIVFFVLSGYVISYVANEKELTLKDFLASRFGRIYSVLLPALILTIILDNIGVIFDSVNYDNYIFNNVITRFFINIFCLQEIFNKSIRFMSNGPLWSLAYEVWYYILFGLLFYNKNSRKIKIIIPILLFIFYKVTILFPIWLLGVFAYKLSKKDIFNKNNSYIAFFTTIIVFIILKKVGALTYFSIQRFGYSQYFIGDYITGVLIFINILSIKNMKSDLIMKLDKIVESLQRFAFSIYLFHFPLLVFFISVFKYNVNNYLLILGIGVLTIGTCYLLSLFTENKKRVYKQLFLKFVDVFYSKKNINIKDFNNTQ